jgi:hypothetical protein
MRIFTLVVGMSCLFAVLLDAFPTIILPRRANSGNHRQSRRRSSRILSRDFRGA